MSLIARPKLVCLILIGLGGIVSGYLLVRSLTLLGGAVPRSVDICSALFGSSGCDAALLSPTSWILGIPLAGWGVVYFFTLAGLLMLGWLIGGSFELDAAIAALLAVAVGSVASVALSVVMLAGAAPVCPLCLVVHGVNLALVVALWYHSGANRSGLLERLKAAGIYLLGRNSSAELESRWKAVGFMAAGLVAVALYQWVLIEAERQRASAATKAALADSPAAILAAYTSTPSQTVPVSAEEPRLGPANALVQIVVFSSFQCPGCRMFADEARRLREDFPHQVAIVFKHYPLGTACNPDLSEDLHPQACERAAAAEAAHRQGRFWAFHDALLAADLRVGGEVLLPIAQQIGLDLKRFEADRRAAATGAKIRADVELGGRLGVDGTPAVFLNGHRVRHLTARDLEVLVRQELKLAQGEQDRAESWAR